MPGQARLGDLAKGTDAHGCKSCTHTVIGPGVQGASDIIVNGLPAMRTGDSGIHMLCCGPNRWSAGNGSKTVLFNGKAAFRKGDPTNHCGGSGSQIQGSGNVVVGDSQAGGFKKAGKNHAPFVCNCNK